MNNNLLKEKLLKLEMELYEWNGSNSLSSDKLDELLWALSIDSDLLSLFNEALNCKKLILRANRREADSE